MATTFLRMAEEAMAQAHAVKANEARRYLDQNSSALLVDVRDETEIKATGLGVGAIHASLGSLAWKADRGVPKKWREPKLQDRSRQMCFLNGFSIERRNRRSRR